jgi:uncharacterized protein YndB with AHSA1/START domain
MVPAGMTSEIHSFDARIGGRFRISLTYDDGGAGKTSERTDTFHGIFDELVPDTKVVQLVEFETETPDLQGVMRISYELTDLEDSTESSTVVVGRHENLPRGVDPEQNEVGWQMSMSKLAALVEGGGAFSAPTGPRP